MRITIVLDDDLVRIAQEFTRIRETTALMREALKALVERESARRLASLGGTMHVLKSIPRRRTRPSSFLPIPRFGSTISVRETRKCESILTKGTL